ncbi:MAG TPA: hypothetical protein VN281_11510 [Verrucomicrobiae bacterium]|jgi:hypothetical protein|nr:hypothetical protein [Verrucomicrobiae bacterium]
MFSSIPVREAQPLGINTNYTVNYQYGNPITYLLGKRRLAPTWLCDPFNMRADQQEANAGKGGSAITGYNYFASIGAVICLGPVDAIYAIYVNGDLLWPNNANGEPPYPTPSVTRGSEDFVTLTVPAGQIIFYWGTETQNPDPVLLSQANHPGYRGVCYCVLNQWSLGFNQTNFQNIEFVLGKWTLNPATTSWFTPTINLADDINPAAYVSDLLQNSRTGLAIDTSQLDTLAIKTAGNALARDGFGLSPLLTTITDFSQLLSDTMQMIQGYIKISDAGLLQINLVRAPAAINLLPIVHDSDLADKPDLKPSDWTTAYTSTQIVFTDRSMAFNQNAVAWRDPGVLSLVAQPDSNQLQWDPVTRQIVAQAIANTAGPASAVPTFTGHLKLRYNSVLFGNLTPGAQFVIGFSGRTMPNTVFRVTARTVPDPAVPEFEIDFTLDLSYLFVPYDTPGAGGGSDPQPGGSGGLRTINVVNLSIPIIELPLGLCPSGKLSLACLPSRITHGDQSWTIQLGDVYGHPYPFQPGSFANLATGTGFARTGTVTQTYPITNCIDQVIGLRVQLTGVDTDIPTADPESLGVAFSDQLLIFVDSEVLSVISVRVLDVATYQFFCLRGRFATQVAQHNAGATIYLIEQKNILPLQHPSFQPNNLVWFKLLIGTSQSSNAVHTTLAGVIYQQTPPINLRVNNDPRSPSYSHGQGISIQWTLTEAGRDLFEQLLFNIQTVLDFLDGMGNVLGTQNVLIDNPAGIANLQLNNAQLVALLGGEVSFTLRARTKVSRDWFYDYSPSTSLAVTKI